MDIIGDLLKIFALTLHQACWSLHTKIDEYFKVAAIARPMIALALTSLHIVLSVMFILSWMWYVICIINKAESNE